MQQQAPAAQAPVAQPQFQTPQQTMIQQYSQKSLNQSHESQTHQDGDGGVDAVQTRKELEQLRELVQEQKSSIARAHSDRELAMQRAAKSERRAEQLAEIAQMACRDIESSLERIASLKMTAHRVQSQTLGPSVQIRMPVERHCLKELQSCRNKVQQLSQTCTALKGQ